MKNIVYYIAIATVLLFASCASELDTEPSGSQVSDEQLGELIKENADLVLAPMMQGAVNYMHTGNRQATTNDRGFMVWNLGMDLQGNDMVLTKLTNWFADEYMFESIRAQTNAYTADRWYCYYKIVYQSNQILDLIPDDVTGKALVYKAQALTYRALAYYYLMCVYQDDYMHGGKDKAGVPLYLTVEGAKGRTPSTEVYSTITTDLQNAIALFEQEGYDPKSSTADIDQTVANMVLARVALTTGDYTTAANAAGAGGLGGAPRPYAGGGTGHGVSRALRFPRPSGAIRGLLPLRSATVPSHRSCRSRPWTMPTTRVFTWPSTTSSTTRSQIPTTARRISTRPRPR